MFKQDLIRAVAEKCNWYEKDAELAVNAVCDVISGELRKGNRVQITNFGTFDVHKWAKTSIQSIHDGKKISIPKRNMPVFKAGTGLKATVRKKK